MADVSRMCSSLEEERASQYKKCQMSHFEIWTIIDPFYTKIKVVILHHTEICFLRISQSQSEVVLQTKSF